MLSLNNIYKFGIEYFNSFDLDELIRIVLEVELVIIFLGATTVIVWKKVNLFLKKKERADIASAILKIQLIITKNEIEHKNEKGEYNFKLFSRSEKSLTVMIELIKYLDKNQKIITNFNKLRKDLFLQMILPLAKKYATTSSLTKRALALKCFMLAPLFIEEEMILHLMDDYIPILRLGAARLAIQLGTPAVVAGTLKFYLQEKRYVRNFIKASTTLASVEFISNIRLHLSTESDPYLQKICLDLLANHLDKKLDHDLVLTLLSTNHKELKLSALRALAYLQLPQTLKILSHCLQDPSWEIRALAAKLTGDGKFVEAKTELEQVIQDPSWWVRRNAGMALLALGVVGHNSLLALKNHDDPYVRDSADLALSIEKLEFLKKVAA